MKKRLFIAIEIPEKLRSQISKAELSVKGFKPVKPDQLHITLRFIGDFPEEDIPVLIAKLKKINFKEFELSNTSPGFFPNRKRPSIFFMGFSPNQEIIRLKFEIDQILETFGFEKDSRDFVPHLTLGRFKKRPEKGIPDSLEEKVAKLAVHFPVKEFILFSSKLTNDGAIHSVESKFPEK